MTPNEIKNLIEMNNRKLVILRDRHARLGDSTLPEVIISIEDIEADIERLQDELATLESQAADAALEGLPLVPSPVERLKYYLYISKFKVDMLWPQIPGGMKAGDVPGGDKTQQLYAKLNSVISYLDDVGEVGTIDDPKRYFRGELTLSWGMLDKESTEVLGQNVAELIQKVVYFGGYTENTILGLGGSAKHLTSAGDIPTAGIFFSSTLALFAVLVQELQKRHEIDEIDKLPSLRHVEETTKLYYKERVGERVEFVAKTLDRGTSKDNRNILFGTPIYVAMAE